MKEDPNDESRFLLENPTRSDFFIVMSMLAVLIEQQDGDSFGISGREETPQERKRREGAAPARGKRSLAGKSTADFY
ncbi:MULTISPECIES: hypothetical protein [Priestia]|nr:MULTISPECIES: hypothetical protein [Priestia]MBX9993271.1 hypothetical protein [Priestia aryabhattai]MCP1450555.1 hypothetical protein [Priestia megaterium]MDC7723144.1 hypothetical protein [Priestia megaterium]MEB2290065.1 hypothetical protein [Priestia megaterium]PEZ12416.1 hypothetical protein CN330_09765 [Priestia megaterium]